MNTAKPIVNFDSRDLDDVLVECYKSTKLYAKILHPELFSSPFSELHDAIFELVDSNEPRVAIAAPRGIGKTTIARTIATKKILFRDKHFVPYVSNSATMAVMQSENIKREMISNNDVRNLFGHVKASAAKEHGFD